jgi:hypothetical protein
MEAWVVGWYIYPDIVFFSGIQEFDSMVEGAWHLDFEWL